MVERRYRLSEQEKLERIREMLDESEPGQLRRIKDVLGKVERRYEESEQEKLERKFKETKEAIDANVASLAALYKRLADFERKFDAEVEARKKHRQLAQQTLRKLNDYIATWYRG